MKIALVIERMDVSRGGRETSTAQIAASLAAAGHQVTVLCQSGGCGTGISPVSGCVAGILPASESSLQQQQHQDAGKMPATHTGETPATQVEVRPLGKGGFFRYEQLRTFVRKVGEEIRREKFDIVHSMLPIPGANVYQLRGGTVPAQFQAGLRRRTPPGRLAAKLARSWNFHRVLMGKLEADVMADPRTHILAVSEMVAREVREFYGRGENLHVVYNAVDIPAADDELRAHWRQELRYRMGLGSGDLLMLTAAGNFELKGVAQTIEALAVWRQRRPDARVHLVVIGRDPVRAEGYARLAGLRSVGTMVHILPPTREIFRWYSAADACVLLSWYDPCSRVVLEATRWGLPSVTTRFNGAAETLASGGGIVVSSPDATDEVVAAMQAMADPARRKEMSRRCLDAAPGLSMKRHVDELVKVYEEIVQQ